VINPALVHHVDHLRFDVVGVPPSVAPKEAPILEPLGKRTLRRMRGSLPSPLMMSSSLIELRPIVGPSSFGREGSFASSHSALKL
jgi:hypothetical protein